MGGTESIIEYLDNNTFLEDVVMNSINPVFTCKMKASGKYYISDEILSFSYEENVVKECEPRKFQKQLNEYIIKESLPTGASQIILLNGNTLIKEDIESGKRVTYIKFN